LGSGDDRSGSRKGEHQLKVLEITRPETHGKQNYTVPLGWNGIMDEFDGAEVGESITITLREMTQESFDALQEFEGW
jgi:hypothetical protein